ncbi:MAG: type I-U CRISPR-associated helicase/endonuclease Cas3 [Terrimicrobiaceae bacterium]|nr:type I-U CRISPR-associated helicase/endonuclease Cas3 [Terrimicrobiaceae bacterium]
MRSSINLYSDLLSQALSLPSGSRPFSWQNSLLDRFLNSPEPFPDALDIPTGLGKTSVMGIWLVAKAAGAPLPRRLIYVVDRRVVVDQATTVAERLRAFVDGNPDLKRDLRLAKPLPISTLRGQHLDNREWAEDPSSPAIIIGTVDMIGSRLLFEGYGVSRKTRSIHAGLLGVDSLVILDESHLVPAFESLLESIASLASPCRPSDDGRSIIPPFRILTLSATGKEKSDVHELSAADLEDGSVSHRRLTAKKRLTFFSHDTGDDFIPWMSNKAWELGTADGLPQRVLVFCSRREDALKVFGLLQEQGRKEEIATNSELLVGSRRVRERLNALETLENHGWLCGSESRPEKPTFLIATSAGEVGVDLDADHLVCDLVEWERMVQRLGRVNRRGHGDANVLVLLEKTPVPSAKEEAALAKAPSERDEKEQKLAEKFQARSAHTQRLRQPFDLLPGESGRTDVSPLALRELQKSTDPTTLRILASASSTVPLHPPLTRPLVDAWSMTSLKEHTGRPNIQPWLRGWVEDEQPQTQVAWRKYLPVSTSGDSLPEKDLSRYFEVAPIHITEILETQTDWVIVQLEARAKALLKMNPDDAELKADTCIGFILDSSGEVVGEPVRLLDWDFNDGEKRKKEDFRRRIAGRMLVLDAQFGGLDKTGLLARTANESVRTADDGGDWSESNTGNAQLIRFRIRKEALSDKDWLLNAKLPLNGTDDAPTTDWMFIYQWRADDSAEDNRALSNLQSLADHQIAVEQCMRQILDRLDLPKDLGEALCIAARIHDEGKNCGRWQDAFHAKKDGRPYAKTQGPISFKKLGGFRHELVSMIRARKNERWQELPPELQELVLHLIAAHHGFARPLIGTEGCDDLPPSQLQHEAVEIAKRFARLQKKYGPWGLAWLESLLRAADQQASRAHAESKETAHE